MGNFPRAWMQGGVNPSGDITKQSTTSIVEPVPGEEVLK